MFLLVYLDSVSLATFVCLFTIRFMVNTSYSKHNTKAVLEEEKGTRTGHSVLVACRLSLFGECNV